MRRLTLLAIAGLATLGLVNAGPATAMQSGEVYQWKDANGVTHYSQTPPAQGQYQQRLITQSGATQPQAASPATNAKESPQCTEARANLTVLQASGAVHEADAEGKPGRALTAGERQNQADLANAAIKAYCTPAR